MALIEAVRARFDIPQRWYRLKAKLLGVDRLADYDRSAPVLRPRTSRSPSATHASSCSTPTAPSHRRRARSPAASSTSIGSMRRCGENKRGGAFCSYTVPSAHPYVMLNYTARRRDVLTMAHELGHGLHAALAQPRGVFHQSTPLTLAETARCSARRSCSSGCWPRRATTASASACSPTGSTGRSRRSSGRWR